ncbi:MAG: haloacid dehalogenase type II [Coriobacteriia bacterium]|nr:haloacid dehalogenase type II [Coriobacteriia bacterium]
MIKAIAFDLYGTLVDVYSVAENCENLFPQQGADISKLWRSKQLEFSWLHTLMNSYKTFWDITKDALYFTLDSLSLSYSDEAIQNLMDSYLQLESFKEVQKALEAMDSYRKVILTNGNLAMCEPLLKAQNLENYFEALISVDTIQQFKPKAAVYQLAVDHFALDPSEIMLVSANPWDISGAKTFGLKAAWIKRSAAQFDYLDQSPDLIVSDLNDLHKKLA